nr:Chain Q, PEPTIDE [Drosophila melanogaster]2E7L_P Chain P, Peptide (GLN)(LEU)(SER)(PRO)(PHE)(PRO)(PHE)(ASP)(LEU) [synthetic construct]2E7L_Q Chain Q, Peptide (GLN)(LEU)(SER)(PRO)(PHE)(PRO)(PHE)(ASP)(LEU) [synthetic construct]2OI9_Q Chain Q, peptide (GLN)(LEU)(SER)(PRO)(PHE)(PRO)(PHE)(ASP)(LEU) [synthetic construct]3E2H_Q Chain Q, QL9 PEPTIDE [synthetic construct]3E3Q_G Chain G, QL9 peptide [synthetic construct]3E3Q_K Chain K, QL9 peptide [synthetic construct]3E3Q_O Chain O, QL9 peptide [sy
QLSPFPFDL